MHVNERLETYQVKRKPWKCLKKRFGVRESDLGGEETKLSRERLREMKTRSHRTYILRFSKSRQIEVSRGIETSIEKGVESLKHRQMQLSRRCRGTKQQTQEKKLDWSTSCREAIEDPGTFSIDPPSCREGVEIMIRTNLRSRQIARCWGGVEIA